MKFFLPAMLVGLVTLLSSVHVAARGKGDPDSNNGSIPLSQKDRDKYSSDDVEASGKRDGRGEKKSGRSHEGNRNRDEVSPFDAEARGKRGGHHGSHRDRKQLLDASSSVDLKARSRRGDYSGDEKSIHRGEGEDRGRHNHDPKQDDVTSRPHKLPYTTLEPVPQPEGKPKTRANRSATRVTSY